MLVGGFPLEASVLKEEEEEEDGRRKGRTIELGVFVDQVVFAKTRPDVRSLSRCGKNIRHVSNMITCLKLYDNFTFFSLYMYETFNFHLVPTIFFLTRTGCQEKPEEVGGGGRRKTERGGGGGRRLRGGERAGHHQPGFGETIPTCSTQFRINYGFLFMTENILPQLTQ